MACLLPHTVDEIHALVQKLIHEDSVRQKAMMDLAVQFDNASAAKQDLRQAYEKCNDIPQETRNLIDAFLKRESDKDYEINLAMYRKAGKIEKQIEAKYVWLSENTNSFHSPTINTNSFHNFFSHIQTTFQKLTMSETNQSNPSAPEKPTEPILQQPYTTPNHDSETHKGGSSSEQNTHKPTSPITHGFLTEKEYQQLLQDEEVLRETLEEQARAEKEWEDRIKKEEAERQSLKNNSCNSDGAKRYGVLATGAAPDTRSIWNSTILVGGSPDKFFRKDLGVIPFCTDKSKIIRKQSKASKHGHENGRVNKNQKQSQEKSNPQSKRSNHGQ
ncbi:hypothetical protein Tco_0816749 [Tanacetum coccineum]